MTYLDFYLEITNVIRNSGYDWDQETAITTINDMQDILNKAKEDIMGGDDGQ